MTYSTTTTTPTPLTSKLSYLKISNADGLHIIQASASYCTQCKTIAPEVQKLVVEFPQAKFYLFDVEEQPDIAQELGIRVMPTFNIFKNGELMEGIVGAKMKMLREAVERNLWGRRWGWDGRDGLGMWVDWVKSLLRTAMGLRGIESIFARSQTRLISAD